MHLRTSSCVTLAALAATSVAWSSPGRAATTQPVTWWIETRPWTCSAQAGPLAREVQLACDATGRCAVASDERSADRRAVLVCADDGWTLEARDASDQPLWTLTLGTTDDDARLRKAGVWIARSEGEGPMARPPSTTTVATTRSPASASPPIAPEPDRVPGDSGSPHLSVAAMFHSSRPLSNASDYDWAWGARAVLAGSAPRTTGPLILGIAGSAEHASGRTDYTLVRAGPTVGLGASVGDFRLGLLGEIGLGLLQVPNASTAGMAFPGNAPKPTQMDMSALRTYVQTSLFAQWSLPGPIHPFLSPTMTWLAMGFPATSFDAIVGLDVGLVWGAI
jgi:hypothetical protein